jgi:outer membrane protein
MKTKQYRAVLLAVMTILGVNLVSGAFAVLCAVEIPQAVRDAIEGQFPGATITETREEMWKGRMITEVEFTARDGIDYEVRVTDNGEILTVEEEKGLPLIGGELAIGIGVLAEREIYRGMDSEIQPGLFLRYENGPFELQAYDGIGASLSVFETEHFAVAVFGSLDIEEGYDPDDSEFLRGMDELDTLYGAGVTLAAGYDGWEAELSFHQDLSAEHDGQSVELGLGRRWWMLGFEWRPEVSVTWMSEEVVDYFYGVSAREARADRPAYSPDSAFEFGAQLLIQRPFLENFTWVGMVEIATFDSEITDSPLVDEDYEFGAVVGVTYAF